MIARLHHGRRWPLWGLSVLALLAVLRMVAPSILSWWITAQMSAVLGVAAEIEDVDLGLLAGEVTVQGIHAAPPVTESASSLDVDLVTIRWSWLDVVRGNPRLEGQVAGVEATIDFYRPWPAARDAASSRSSRLRELSISDSAVWVVLAADTPPILSLTGVRGSMRTTAGPRSETMTTQVSITARANETGTFTLAGAFAPADPAASWSLRFALEQLDLRPLNPLFQQVFEMDLEHGWLSLAGGLTVALGRMRGRLHPRFDELQVLGHGERHVRHPMAEALFSSMLSGADLPIDIDRPVLPSGESMFEAVKDIDAEELLSESILRGFIRRLDTLDGYDPAVARAEIDFPAGRLSFFDITMRRTGGGVDSPFVSIARMDIIVEQSAADAGAAPTYKSIALHEPALVFVTGETPAKSQIMFDPEWQAKVNVLPYPTDRFEIFDGRVEYRDDTTSPSTSLIISDLELRADNLARAKGRRAAKLLGKGKVMDLSTLELEIEFSPGMVDLDAAARLRLDPLPLRELDQLLKGRVGVDLSSGTLALSADLDAYQARLTGTVTPGLRDVRVLGVDEAVVTHPVRELMLERRLRKLDGVTLTLDRRVRTSVIRELPAALMSAARRAR